MAIAHLNGSPPQQKHRSHPTECDQLIQVEVEFVRAHRALLSPIRRLPTEILAEIITATMLDTMFFQPVPGMRLRPVQYLTAPWTPSYVSRFWRSTTLSLSHLWGQIAISSALPKGMVAIVDMCLRRSCCAPLHIYINASHEISKEFMLALDRILEHAERWKSLFIISQPTFISSLSAAKHRLHILTRLWFTALEVDNNALGGHFISLFEAAPKLTAVAITGPFRDRIIMLPWSQLSVYFHCIFPNSSHDSDRYIEPLERHSSSLNELLLHHFTLNNMRKHRNKIRLESLRHLSIVIVSQPDPVTGNGALMSRGVGNPRAWTARCPLLGGLCPYPFCFIFVANFLFYCNFLEKISRKKSCSTEPSNFRPRSASPGAQSPTLNCRSSTSPALLHFFLHHQPS